MNRSIKVLIYQKIDNDGVIITDEVLKILGGNIDPKKVKIGNRNQR